MSDTLRSDLILEGNTFLTVDIFSVRMDPSIVMKRRELFREFNTSYQSLRSYPDKFQECTRISGSAFDYVLRKIDAHLRVPFTNFLSTVSPEENLSYLDDHVYVPALDLRVVRRDDENVEAIEENFPVADDDEGLQEKTVPAHESKMNNGKDAAVTGHEVEDQEAQLLEEANNLPGVRHEMEGQSINGVEQANKTSVIRNGQAEQRTQFNKRENAATGSIYKVAELLAQPVEVFNNRGAATHGLSEQRTQPLQRASSGTGAIQIVYKKHTQPMEEANNRDSARRGLVNDVSQPIHGESSKAGTRHGFVKQRPELVEEANSRAGVILQGAEQRTLPLGGTNIIASVRHDLTDQQEGHILVANNGDGTRHCRVEQDQNVGAQNVVGTNHRIIHQQSQPAKVPNNRTGAQEERLQQQEKLGQKANDSAGDSPRVLEQKWQPMKATIIADFNTKQVLLVAGGQPTQSMEGANNGTGTRQGALEQRGKPMGDANNRPGVTQVVTDQQAQPTERVNNRSATRYGLANFQPLPSDKTRIKHYYVDPGQTHGYFLVEPGTTYIVVHRKSQPMDGANNSTGARGEVLENREQYVRKTDDTPDDSSTAENETPAKVGKCCGRHAVLPLILAEIGQQVEEANNITGTRQVVLEQRIQSVEEAKNRVVAQQAQPLEAVNNIAIARYSQVGYQARPTDAVNNGNGNRRGEVEQQPPNLQVSTSAAGGRQKLVGQAAQPMVGDYRVIATRQQVVEHQPQPIQGANTASQSRSRVLEQQVVPVEERNNRAGTGGRDGDSHLAQAMGRAISSSFARVGIVGQGAQPVQGSNTEAVRRRSMGEHLAQPVPVEERNNRAGSGSRDGDSHLAQAVGRAISSSSARVGIVEQGAQPVRGSNTEAVRRQSMGEHLAQPVPVEGRNNRAGSGSRDGDSHLAQAVGRAISSSFARVGIVEQGAQPVRGSNTEAVRRQSMGEHLAQPVPVEGRNNRAGSGSRDGDSHLAQAVGRAISSSFARVGIVEQGAQPVQGSNTEAVRRQSMGEHLAQPVPVEERNNRAGSGSRDGDSHLAQAVGRAISSSFARVGIVEQGAQPVQGSNTEAVRRQSMGEHLAQPVPVEGRNNRAGSGSRDGDSHLAQAVGRAISSSFARVGIVEQGAQPVQGSNTEAVRRQSMGEHLAQPVPVEGRNNRAGSGSRDGDSHLPQAVGRAISSSFARVGIVEQGAQPVQGSNTEAVRRQSMGEHLAQPVPVEERNNRAGSGSRDGDSHLAQAVGRAISSSFARVGIVEQGAQPVQRSNTEAVRRQSMGEHLAQPVPVDERNNRAGSGSRDGDSHLAQAVGRAISSSFARVGIVEQGAQPVQGSNTEAVRRQSMGEHLAQPVPVEERNNRAGSGSRDGESNPLSARHRNAERAQAVGRAISSSSARVGIVQQEAQPVRGCCCQAVAGRSIGQHRAQPVPVEERNNRGVPCSSSSDGGSNLLCDRHRNPERAQAVGRAISSSSARVGIVEQGAQPVQGSSSDADNNRRSTGEDRAQPVRIARQRVVLQRAQSMSAANRRAGTSRGRPMDGWQLPDSTVDENNKRIVQEPPRGMHWLRTYTDNEAEGVVIDGSNPSQRNRSHANEAERDTSSPEVVVLAELPPTRISRAVGDSASRSSSSRDELSPDVILVAEIPTGRNVRAICPNQQQQQSEAQPSGSAQQGSSAQASFSPRPGCSHWGEDSAQPGCPVSSRAHPQPCHSSFSCGSRRPSAQAGGSRWPSDSAETSGSAESGGSSRASGSSESDGLNRSSSSTASDISSQTNGSAESEGSNQASGSVESDGSSRTSGSARSDSSRRASGSAGLVASSRASGSAESNGSRRATGLSWSRVSSSPSGSASSSGSARSSRTAQAGNPRDADSFSEDTTSDDSYDETDLSSRVPSTDTRKGQIAFLRRRDIYKGIDFYVTQIYEYKELMDLSRIFELSSVDEDTDIDMYMPAGNDSDDEGEESHATRGQISFSQGAEAQFNIISESESEEEEEEEEEEGEEEDSSDDQVPTGKKMVVKRQRPSTNGRTKRKKIQVKRKSQAGRKKRRKM